jgi:hypothetical protein
MPSHTCSCGSSFPNGKELRVHIALETERWPFHRCSPEHHDPDSSQDALALRWLAVEADRVRTEAYIAANWPKSIKDTP